MKKNSRFSPPVIGGSSLLIIFAVLCFTIFALLALSTVQANCRLSDTSIDAVADYYAADGQAEDIFAQLRAGEIPEGVEVRGSTYSYTCTISDNQILEVELLHDDSGWSVLRWQAVSTLDSDHFGG